MSVTQDEGRQDGTRGRWLRAAAGWGLFGAVVARLGLRVHAPGTQPDTIRGTVLESPGGTADGLDNQTLTISPSAAGGVTSATTDASGDYTFSVAPGTGQPVDYTVTLSVPSTHTTIPGHPTAVTVRSTGQEITYIVDFMVQEVT